MNLPIQYSYNPKLKLILLVIGSGIAWIIVQRVSWGTMPESFSLWFGLIPVFMGLLMTIRMVAFNRQILFDVDAMTLPTGLFRLQTTRIPYVDIRKVWQSYLPYTGIIRFATKTRKFVILSTMLPDHASYVAIGEFLNSKALENMGNA
jgi:hypothetical protein